MAEEADAGGGGGGGAEDGGIETEEEAVGVHGALQLRLALLLPIRCHGRRDRACSQGGVWGRGWVELLGLAGGGGGRHWRRSREISRRWARETKHKSRRQQARGRAAGSSRNGAGG